MPVQPEFNPDYLYFVTTSADNHIHIFNREAVIRVLLDSLDFLRANNRMSLFAFVIMPNHIHFIARFGRKHTLSDTLRDFKRHTARQIINQLRARDRSSMLARLQDLNQDWRQTYKVWEDGYDAREVFSPWFLEQKMDYIHYNPCQPHWKLAALPEDYPWSSARYYLADKTAIIHMDDARDLFS